MSTFHRVLNFRTTLVLVIGGVIALAALVAHLSTREAN